MDRGQREPPSLEQDHASDQANQPQPLEQDHASDQAIQPQPLEQDHASDQAIQPQPLEQDHASDQAIQPQPLEQDHASDQANQPQPLEQDHASDQAIQPQPLEQDHASDQAIQPQPLEQDHASDQANQPQPLEQDHASDQAIQPQPLEQDHASDQVNQPQPLEQDYASDQANQSPPLELDLASVQAIQHTGPGSAFLIINEAHLSHLPSLKKAKAQGQGKGKGKDKGTPDTDKEDKSIFKVRQGATKDRDTFRAIFETNLGMISKKEYYFPNLSLKKWDHKFDTSSQQKKKCQCFQCQIAKMNFDNADKIVLAISSHGKMKGGEPCVQMYDAGPFLRRSDIIDALGDERCPKLKGKVRIVIWCACRRDPKRPEKDEDDGIEDMTESTSSNAADDPRPGSSTDDPRPGSSTDDPRPGSSTDDPRPGSSTDDPRPGSSTDDPRPGSSTDDTGHNVDDAGEEQNESSEYKEDDTSDEGSDEDDDDPTSGLSTDKPQPAVLDVPKDFIFVYSVPIGKSKRDPKLGTWLMKELMKVVDKIPMNTDVNFLQLMTRTNFEVCQLEDKKGEKRIKNTLCIEHRLTRQVMFRKSEPTLPGGDFF